MYSSRDRNSEGTNCGRDWNNSQQSPPQKVFPHMDLGGSYTKNSNKQKIPNNTKYTRVYRNHPSLLHEI